MFRALAVPSRLAVVVVVFLSAAGCVVVRPAGDPSSASGAGQNDDGGIPEPSYADARATVDRANAELSSDPSAAAKDFLAARESVFRTFAGAQRRPSLIFVALIGGIDQHAPFGRQANELLWRTVIGRTAALKTLGREEEAIVEFPKWNVADVQVTKDCPPTMRKVCLEEAVRDARDEPAFEMCPASLTSACADHLAWFAKRFPEYTTEGDEAYLKADLNLDEKEGENALRDLPTLVKKLPDKRLVVRVTLAGWQKEKDGTATLIRDRADTAFTSYQDTGKRVLTAEGDHLVVHKVVTDVEHTEEHSNSVSIHLAPGQTWGGEDARGADIVVLANMRKARTTHEGPRVRFHIDQPVVISYAYHYYYGVDLSWARDGR